MFSFRAAAVQASYCLRVSLRHAFTTLPMIVLDGQSASRRAPRAAGPAPNHLAILAIDVHLLADRAGKPAFAYFHVRSWGRGPPVLAVARAVTTGTPPIVPPTQRPIKPSIPPPRNPISPAVQQQVGTKTQRSPLD